MGGRRRRRRRRPLRRAASTPRIAASADEMIVPGPAASVAWMRPKLLAILSYYGISVFFFLRIWIHARPLHRPSAIQDPAVAEPSKTCRPREAPAAEGAPRIAPR